jgi:hypothetical protein
MKDLCKWLDKQNLKEKEAKRRFKAASAAYTRLNRVINLVEETKDKLLKVDKDVVDSGLKED